MVSFCVIVVDAFFSSGIFSGRPEASSSFQSVLLDSDSRTMPATPLHWLAGRLSSLWSRNANSSDAKEERVYVPTGSAGAISNLFQNFPRHTVLLADFDFLPGAFGGVNAPLIQRKEKGSVAVAEYASLTHDDVISGKCDILFPTNFKRLEHLYKHTFDRTFSTGPHSGTIPVTWTMAQSEFLKQNAEWTHGNTRCGYNPLLEDYTNMTMFCGQSHKTSN
eukprot:c16930_g1_i2.p1 GENE.c16930_g1_i2~~c16930_g1_i2.p1  ORF type:complete len:220 (+),score=47.89 c16930_g1_i2:840-1499(+)